jgi:general secretion pathway protein E
MLNQAVADLIADKMIARETGEQFLTNRRSFQSSQHPLIPIDNQKWKDLRDPRETLHLENLTQWLAAKCGLDYFHIDPFKVDFSTMTKVMSNAYAERYKTLPMAASKTEATTAGAAFAPRAARAAWPRRPPTS